MTFIERAWYYAPTRGIILSYLYANALSQPDYDTSVAAFERRVSRIRAATPMREHVVEGISEFSFTDEGLIASHTIDNVVPLPLRFFLNGITAARGDPSAAHAAVRSARANESSPSQGPPSV